MGLAAPAQADNDPAGVCHNFEQISNPPPNPNYGTVVHWDDDQILTPLVIQLTDNIPTTQRDAQARVQRYFDRNCPQYSARVKRALAQLPMMVPPEFY